MSYWSAAAESKTTEAKKRSSKELKAKSVNYIFSPGWPKFITFLQTHLFEIAGLWKSQSKIGIRKHPMNELKQCLVLFMALFSIVANAQRCGATCANAEALLGMSEQMLTSSIPELKRVSKPVQGPNKSRGKWALPDTRFATQPYAATFFIRDGQVRRIEYLSTAPQLQCTQRVPFQLALADLEKTYGKSQVTSTLLEGGSSMQSVAFSSQVTDISLHFSLSPDDCSTRVIFKIREVRDASEL